MTAQNFETIQDVGIHELKRRLMNQIRKISGAEDSESDVLQSIDHELVWFQDGVHFDLTFHPFQALAQKCLTQITSRALVNGWMPIEGEKNGDIKLTLALPNQISVGMMEEFVAGLNAASEIDGIRISNIEVTAARAAFGVACSFQYSIRESPLGSSIAQKPKPGDAICVTGDLGAAFAGLRILLREKRIWTQQQELHKDPTIAFEPELEEYAESVKRQLAPVTRKDLVLAMQASQIWPTSLTLLQDGLYNDLQNLMIRTSVGAEIYESALPISLTTREIANELEEDVDRYAFLGGEDYELVFTLPKDKVDAFQEHFQDFVVIGEVKPQKEQLLVHTTDRGIEKHRVNGKS